MTASIRHRNRMPRTATELNRISLLGCRYAVVCLIFLSSACSNSSDESTADDSSSGEETSVTEPEITPSSEPCAGLFSGDVITTPENWNNIECVVTSTNPCALTGYQTRAYQICQSRQECSGVCPCGADGQECTRRTLEDVAPCELPTPTENLQEGPWGACNTDLVCSLTGTQSRFVLVCQGSQTATISESQSCSRTVNTDDLVTGVWDECAYEDACVQTGTRSREREVCDGELLSLSTDSETCSRSTEGLIVTDRFVGNCAPIDVLDCSPLGTRTSTFSECINGISTSIDITDSRAVEPCELPKSQVEQVIISNASATTAQSQVEISQQEAVTASPTPAFDGQATSFEYVLSSITSTSPISPASLVLTLSDGTELRDENGDGTIVSGDGLSTGTIDYETGLMSAQLSVAPQAGVETTITIQKRNDLVVTSEFSSSALALCRLTKIHGDFHLTLGSTVTTVALDQLTEIYGNLTIEQLSSTSPTSYDFSALQKVHGHLTIRNSYLNQIAMPLLTAIGGDLVLSENGGTEIRMAQLATVSNFIVGTSTGVSNANSTLVRFDLPSLQTINGDFVVADNPILAAWSVDVQKVHGQLFINQNNLDTCTLYNSYVTPIQSQLGVDGDITVNSTNPATDPNYLDSDGDGYVEQCDNCPGLFNPNQVDSDNNGIGDECEP